MNELRTHVLQSAFAIAIVLAVAWLVFNIGTGLSRSRAAANLEAKIAMIRAMGDPADLADFKRDPLPAERNAATYLWQARKDLDAVQQVLDALEDPVQEDLYSRFCLTPSTSNGIRSALKGRPNLVPLLLQAADCDDVDFELNVDQGTEPFFESLERTIVPLREARNVLLGHVLVLLADDQPAEAFKVALSMLRMARLGERVPTYVGYLIDVEARFKAIQAADRCLRAGPIDRALRDALEAELAQVDSIEVLRSALTNERAVSSAHFDEFYGALISSTSKTNNPVLPRAAALDKLAYLESFDEPLGLISKPYGQVATAIRACDDHQTGGVVTAMVRPAIGAAFDCANRDLAYVRCLRLLNAMQMRESIGASNQNVFAGIDLSKDVTIDPFTGGQLIARDTPGGWLIYSVGDDLKNDGGKLNQMRDVGVGPSECWVDEDAPH